MKKITIIVSGLAMILTSVALVEARDVCVGVDINAKSCTQIGLGKFDTTKTGVLTQRRVECHSDKFCTSSRNREALEKAVKSCSTFNDKSALIWQECTNTEMECTSDQQCEEFVRANPEPDVDLTHLHEVEEVSSLIKASKNIPNN